MKISAVYIRWFHCLLTLFSRRIIGEIIRKTFSRGVKDIKKEAPANGEESSSLRVGGALGIGEGLTEGIIVVDNNILTFPRAKKEKSVRARR